MPLDVYNLIERIRPRPALYLGAGSVSLMRAFLDGYLEAATECPESAIEQGPPFQGFHDWVAMKLGYYESTSGWANMLLAAENGDEAKALDRFFVYLDEFKQRQATIILWAIPDSGKSWRYQIVDGERIDLPFPSTVQIVKYDESGGVFIRYMDENGKLIDREEYCQDLAVAFSLTQSLVNKDDWRQPEKHP